MPERAAGRRAPVVLLADLREAAACAKQCDEIDRQAQLIAERAAARWQSIRTTNKPWPKHTHDYIDIATPFKPDLRAPSVHRHRRQQVDLGGVSVS